MNKYAFQKAYWGKDQSTAVQFEPINELPERELITACMVLAHHEGTSVVLTRPARGWGLPGGHRESNETPEECLRREAMEEAFMTLTDLQLVGRWKTEKVFQSPHNAQYPDIGYQLLYSAEVDVLGKFTPQMEILERALVPIHEVKNYHHDFGNIKDIFDYACEVAGLMKLANHRHKLADK